MLQRKGNQYRLYPHKVTVKEHGKERTTWALPSKEWWTETADKHDHVEVIKFEEIEVTEDMQKRYEQIKRMPEDFGSVYQQYVLDGTLPDNFPSNHPFQEIILRNENESKKEDIDVTAETVVMNAEDSMMTAETVSNLMMEIQQLRAEVEALKNG